MPPDSGAGSFGVLIALEGKDMIGYGKTEEAIS